MQATGRTSTIELRVRWGETDAAGIVFYPNYYVWFDVAAHELLRGRYERGFGFPIVESGAKFHAPLFPDEVITIETVVADLLTKALRLEHTIRRGGTLIAEGFEVRVYVKLLEHGIEARAIPEDLRNYLLQGYARAFRFARCFRRRVDEGGRARARRDARRSVSRDRRNHRSRREGRRSGAAVHERERLALSGLDESVRDRAAHRDGLRRRPAERARSACPSDAGLLAPENGGRRLREAAHLGCSARRLPAPRRNRPGTRDRRGRTRSTDPPHPHHLAARRGAVHHAPARLHEKSGRRDPKHRDVPDAGLRCAHDRDALAASQAGPRTCPRLGRTGPLRGRARRRSDPHLRGDRAAPADDRRSPLRRLPAREADPDDAGADRRPRRPGRCGIHPRRLRRQRRPAQRRAVRRSHRRLQPRRALSDLSPPVHHAPQGADLSGDGRRKTADGRRMARESDRTNLPPAAADARPRDRRLQPPGRGRFSQPGDRRDQEELPRASLQGDECALGARPHDDADPDARRGRPRRRRPRPPARRLVCAQQRRSGTRSRDRCDPQRAGRGLPARVASRDRHGCGDAGARHRTVAFVWTRSVPGTSERRSVVGARRAGTRAAPARTAARTMKNLALFLRDIRIEHTLFALPFAYVGAVMAAGGIPTPWQFLWITLAVLGARTAAMAANRFLDREIDARNPRTANRPTASGRLSPRVMLAAIVAGLALLTVSAAMLNPLCLRLFPIAAFAVLFYPLCKRFTWVTHFFLGAVDGLAPLGAFIGVSGTFTFPAILLFVAVTLWVAGFDIIYALMDYPIDVEQGIRSIPARFGTSTGRWLPIVLHLAMTVLLFLAGGLSHAGMLYYAGVVFAVILVFYEDRTFSVAKNLFALNDRVFVTNMVFSVVFLVTTIAGFTLR